MCQRVHDRSLCSCLTGGCLLSLFAVSRATADPLPPSPPVPLSPLLLSGTLFFILIPRVDFDLFGDIRYSSLSRDRLRVIAECTLRPSVHRLRFWGARLTQANFNLAVQLPPSPTKWRFLVLSVPFRS